MRSRRERAKKKRKGCISIRNCCYTYVSKIFRLYFSARAWWCSFINIRIFFSLSLSFFLFLLFSDSIGEKLQFFLLTF